MLYLVPFASYSVVFVESGHPTKGVDLTGLLGGQKEDWRSRRLPSPSRVQGRSLSKGSGGLPSPSGVQEPR